MLFDLRGKRRRLIQVVYACLALLMGGSLVLFGIGSDAPGGILDGLGVTDGSGATDPRYQEEIDRAEEQLETDPDNREALITLARYHYLSATGGVVTDPETGQRQISEDARAEMNEALDAWDRYLETNPQPADASLARNMAQVNELLFSDALGRGDAARALETAEASADAYEIAARAEGGAVEWNNLARYRYIAGQDDLGERALDRALALADSDDPDELEETLRERVREARRLNRQLQELVDAGDTGTGRIEDPFGGLGGDAGAGGAPMPVP